MKYTRSYARPTKLIAPALQLKLIGMFFGIACVGVMTQTLFLNRGLMDLSESLPNGADALAAVLPGLLIRSLLTTMCLLAPLALTAGILITFRIAGPLHRFKLYFRAIADGEQPGKCSVRERDELHDLCALINRAMERLEVEHAAPGVGARKGEPELESELDPEPEVEPLKKAS